MKYEVPIDWNAFAYNNSKDPQHAFEQLTYFLFCAEHHQTTGIFRYFNQPNIETQPVFDDGKLIGFQSKYYKPTIKLSEKAGELEGAIRGASIRYPGISRLVFYISIEFSPSTKKDRVKPEYQVSIEKVAADLGIEIEWRCPSNIEAQLMLDEQLKSCKELFFGSKSDFKQCFSYFERKKEDLLRHIKTCVFYKDKEISLDRPTFDLRDFINSDDQVLVVDGVSGSGKSAIVATCLKMLEENTAILALNSTDLDVPSMNKLWNINYELSDEDFFSIYKGADDYILYLDAVEKYFVMENQPVFEDFISCFIDKGWKLIISVRSSYTSLLPTTILKGIKSRFFHVVPIPIEELNSLACENSFFLPEDRQLLELLRIPFYLGLYLDLEGIDSQSLIELNKASFREKIWEEIIRNNNSRKDNMPNRREQALISMTLHMLNHGTYSYLLQDNDDYKAFDILEKRGVLSQSVDARKYYHGHDVFEELVVNYVFSDRWKRNVPPEEFFSSFSPTLRVRRLFRNWLVDFASTAENHSKIGLLLAGDTIDAIWKDEIIRSILSTEYLEDTFTTLLPIILKNNGQLLKRIIFLLNTCCRKADNSGFWTESEKLQTFRTSKPSGYAWTTVFNLIWENRGQLAWDEELLSLTINALSSWTSNGGNRKAETTKIAGNIGLFLFEKNNSDNEFKHLLSEDELNRLLKVILESGFMISSELSRIFQIVIDEQDDECSLFGKKRKKKTYPPAYRKLAKNAVFDLMHCGNVPIAMPEMTLNLMGKLWLYSGDDIYNSGPGTETCFGINPNLSITYSFPHAYQTPILLMLKEYPTLVTNFIIKTTNYAGDRYVNSHLNTDYKECQMINLYIDGQEKKQIASQRLWQLYRGTSVGPNLLVSLLMGYEQWLLDVVKTYPSEEVVNYCRYVLKSANNVMITSIIVSITTAFPEKTFPLICDLLKTKELFGYDLVRRVDERSSSFLLPGNDPWMKIRIKSNELPHRSKRLEDVILELQTGQRDLSEDDRARMIKTLYNAIDEAVSDIDSWETEYKYPYYRMDLRKYTETLDKQIDDRGRIIYTIVSEYSADMKEKSKARRCVQEKVERFLELSLWSRDNLEKSEKAQNNEKFSDTKIVIQELRELWDLLCNRGDDEFKDGFISCIGQDFSCALQTSSVLLRDRYEELKADEIQLCEYILLSLSHQFVRETSYNIISMNHEMEALAVGLPLLLTLYRSDESKVEEILCLLLKLQLLDWRSDSRFTLTLAKQLWTLNERNGTIFLYALAYIADSFERTRMIDRATTVSTYFETHAQEIHDLLSTQDFQITSISFDQLNVDVIYTILSLTAPGTEIASTLANMSKRNLITHAFCPREKNNSSNMDGYKLRYVYWLAEELLLCENDVRKELADAFIAYADFEADNTCSLIRQLIFLNGSYGRNNAFWHLWELLKPKLLELSNQKATHLPHKFVFPIGIERTIHCYLFGDSYINNYSPQHAVITEEQTTFLSEIVENAGCFCAVLSSIAHILCTIGKESFAERGVDWIFHLIKEDSDSSAILYTNTLYDLEDYVDYYISKNKTTIREKAELLQKIQAILGYMINKGSFAASFLLETI